MKTEAFIKVNNKFMTLRMNGTWGYAPNMEFAYTFPSVQDAQRFAPVICRIIGTTIQAAEITDTKGNIIHN